MEIIILVGPEQYVVPNWVVVAVALLALVGACALVVLVFRQTALWWSAGVIVWPAVVRMAEHLPDVEAPSLPLAERARG
jgi:hypothetical protein